MDFITTLHSYVFSHQGGLYRFTREVEELGRVRGMPQCYLASEAGFREKLDDDSLPSVRAALDVLIKRGLPA